MSEAKERPALLDHPAATGIILESISDGVFTIDHDWRITSFNRAAEEITGIPREEAIGRRCSEVLRANMCEADCALRRTMEEGEPVIGEAAYIIDADGERIPITLSTALLRDGEGHVIGGVETFRDLSIVEELRKELEGRFTVGDIVSRSPAMRRILDVLPQVASSESTVLIQGETGTGKEVLARALHDLSPRNQGPFVAVNCGALPDTLLESELFGYKAGAFTGADRDKPGRFALASQGTLFLDEIGDVSPALQVRLLRVLQERVFEPLGGREPEQADVRVMAASNKDLKALVAEGTFRQDLFYRINVIRMALPPLRERREDIPLLVEYFIDRFNAIQKKAIEGVSPDTMAMLMAHDYAGNIRELENIIEHAFVLRNQGMIEPQDLPPNLAARRAKPSQAAAKMSKRLAAVEAQAIMEALERNGYNREAAARELGIHKTTLFRKVKSLGLTLPVQDGRSRKGDEG